MQKPGLNQDPAKKFTRRDLIRGMGAIGAMAIASPLTSLIACSSTTVSTGGTPSSSPSASVADNPDCLLVPEETEGPYYIKASKVRQDITDGKTGVPLELSLVILNARTCQPIDNAMVDLWHADAEGIYSAYTGQGDGHDVDTTGQTFLRGIQVTGADGKVTFKTIYPGWYRGRTTHIHFKVHFNDNTVATSQIYFPEDINSQVYSKAPAYKARGQKDTPNASDMVYLPANLGERTVLKLTQQGDGYTSTLKVGVVVS